MNKKHSSFTLLELIITVIIIGILGALVIPMYGNVVEKKRGEACINNMRIIIAAERIYFMKIGSYYSDYNVFSGDATLRTPGDLRDNLDIEITENYFGDDAAGTAGYRITYYPASNMMYVRNSRLNGTYSGRYIRYRMDFDDSSTVLDGTWPLLPT